MTTATATSSQVEAEAFGDCLERMADRVADGPYDKPLEQCKELVKQNIRDNFTSSATPDGAPWRSRKTNREQNPMGNIVDDGHPLLMDTGKLVQAATGGGAGNVARVSSHELEYGVNLDSVPYARAHDYGYPPRKLPERHYLGVGEETVDAFEQLIGDFVANELI